MGPCRRPEGVPPLVVRSLVWYWLPVLQHTLLTLLDMSAKHRWLRPRLPTTAVVKSGNQNGMTVMCFLDACSCFMRMWSLGDWAKAITLIWSPARPDIESSFKTILFCCQLFPHRVAKEVERGRMWKHYLAGLGDITFTCLTLDLTCFK